jgi:hypothetical protein
MMIELIYRVRGEINISYEHEYVCEECGREAYHGGSDTLKIDKLIRADFPKEAGDKTLCEELAIWRQQHGNRFYAESTRWAKGDPQIDLMSEDVLMRMCGAPMLPQLEGL